MKAQDYEFPPAALFTTIAVCPWRERSPRVDGKLGDWDDSQIMPPLGELSGGEQFARVLLAWNDRGLYFAVDVAKNEPVVVNRQTPASADAVELFINTRAASTGHRATQFCYHLIILPRSPGAGRGGPMIWQRPLRRALQKSPPVDFDAIRLATDLRVDGYAIELAMPPDALRSLELTAGARLGMAVVVHDIQRGTECWGTSDDFPYDRDPSTWGLVEFGPIGT